MLLTRGRTVSRCNLNGRIPPSQPPSHDISFSSQLALSKFWEMCVFQHTLL